MKAVHIPTDRMPVTIDLEPDADGSTLDALQRLVGGNIEAFDVLFGSEICIYCNDEGLFTCQPNRAIFATKSMEQAGYLSQMDYIHPVREGDLYTILFGDLVATGYDPETGEGRDLTDAEIQLVEHYFTYISGPESSYDALMFLRGGVDQRSDQPVALKEEARSARDAAGSLDVDGTPSREWDQMEH